MPAFKTFFSFAHGVCVVRLCVSVCVYVGMPTWSCAAPGASVVLRSGYERPERLGELRPSHLCPLQPGEWERNSVFVCVCVCMCVCEREVLALYHTEGMLVTPSPQRALSSQFNPFHTSSTAQAPPPPRSTRWWRSSGWNNPRVAMSRRRCSETVLCVSFAPPLCLFFLLLSLSLPLLLSLSFSDSATPALPLIFYQFSSLHCTHPAGGTVHSKQHLKSHIFGFVRSWCVVEFFSMISVKENKPSLEPIRCQRYIKLRHGCIRSTCCVALWYLVLWVDF